MYRKILVCYDGSEGSRSALTRAISLAKSSGGEVAALWVRGSLPHYPETVDEIEQEKEATDSYWQKLRREINKIASQEGIEVHAECQFGNPAKTILEYAELGSFDLIVLGHRGHSGLWGRFLGHTADRVSENATCSVLIVRPGL